MLTRDNPYTSMQRNYYDHEGITGNMNRENHAIHNNNPDYWYILVEEVLRGNYKDKIGLDFGCGCGRNVMNLYSHFKKMEGVDISEELVKTSYNNMRMVCRDPSKYDFYTCDGISLEGLESGKYSFIMSTIVLQHICVYDIRFNYLKEFYRILEKGGMISIQMGYDTELLENSSEYYENFYEAVSTNSGHDVRVSSPHQLIGDLTKIGFERITYDIRPPHCDRHQNWIFIKAYKPL